MGPCEMTVAAFVSSAASSAAVDDGWGACVPVHEAPDSHNDTTTPTNQARPKDGCMRGLNTNEAGSDGAGYPAAMPSTLWVTSDTHFWHEESLDLYKRPFLDVEAMNDAFIDAINGAVRKGDELWHLGDFVGGLPWKKQPRRAVKLARACRERIRCERVHLVRGNHDPRLSGFERLFASVHDIATWKGWERGAHRIVLCHYPLLSWQGRWNGALHLHGHLHGGLPSEARSIDVGVDCHRYRPARMEAMLARCVRQPIQHLDEYQRPRTR